MAQMSFEYNYVSVNAMVRSLAYDNAISKEYKVGYTKAHFYNNMDRFNDPMFLHHDKKEFKALNTMHSMASLKDLNKESHNNFFIPKNIYNNIYNANKDNIVCHSLIRFPGIINREYNLSLCTYKQNIITPTNCYFLFKNNHYPIHANKNVVLSRPMTLNIFKDLFTTKKDYIMNLSSLFTLVSPIKQLNVHSLYALKNKSDIKRLNVNQIKMLQIKHLDLISVDIITCSKTLLSHLNTQKFISLENSNKATNTYMQLFVNNLNRKNNQLKIYDLCGLYKEDHDRIQLYNSSVLLKDKKRLGQIKDEFMLHDMFEYKNTSYYNDLYTYRKNYLLNNFDMLSLQKEMPFPASKINNMITLSPQIKKLLYGQNTEFLRQSYNTTLQNTFINMKTPYTKKIMHKEQITLSREILKLPISESIFVLKDGDVYLNYLDDTSRLLKIKRKTVLPDTTFAMTMDNKQGYLKKQQINAFQENKTLIVNDFDSFILKNILPSSTITLMHQQFYNNTLAVLIPMSKSELHGHKNILNVLANKLQSQLANIKCDQIHGTITRKTFKDEIGIWANNAARQTLIEYTDIIIAKNKINALLNNDRIFVKSPRKTTIESYNILADKKMKFSQIEKTNISTGKYKKNFLLESESMYKKFLKLASHLSKIKKEEISYETRKSILLYDKEMFAQHLEHDSFILYNRYEYLTKISKNFRIEKTEDWYYKIAKPFMDNEDTIFWYNKIPKPVQHIYEYENQLFIEKIPKLLYYENINGIYLSSQEHNIKTEDTTEFTYKNEKQSFTSEDYTWITKDSISSSLIVQELDRLNKIQKDLEKNVTKNYNWVYSYNYEDGIEPNEDIYGIDELLLPQNDIDYQQFENLIFNKKTMRPKAPVKIIDDHTFIAKYPIKHPIPNYKDVGIEYIDVPSSLMYDIFLKFYQIWYANVFKFGNMDMTASVNLMLDYMYSFILNTYSGSDLFKEALRVFRLIRWFAETSIMHNANYLISFNYEDLKSNLYTGNCDIEYTSSAFEIDNKLNVFSIPEQEYKTDAFLDFNICNTIDTTISFSISFIHGYVEVWVNDEKISVITKSSNHCEYELLATKTSNHVILKRPSEANINYCYIGNIIVRNGKYKDLNITYDPDLKKGNMPLNDVVQKMILLANLYGDNQELLEQYKKGNFGVSTLFEKLNEYWELHHKNKIKGKRLTIKEV